MKPSFLRFPGGNNLEGATVADRWQCNATIGLVEDRPGRQGMFYQFCLLRSQMTTKQEIGDTLTQMLW
jgi:alpha-L-arabinofuranosidase